MIKKHVVFLLVATLLLVIAGCDRRNPDNESFTPFTDLVVDGNFDFNTLRTVAVHLEASNNQGNPLTGTVFRIYDADPDNGGLLVSTGAIDQSGNFDTSIAVATGVRELYAVGLMQTVKIPIVSGQASYVFGGVPTQKATGFKPVHSSSKDWQFLPWLSYNNLGVPSPMTFEPLSADFLANINNTYPEREYQPTLHPNFFAPGVQRNIKVNAACELYITFIHDGAGYQNALGFYTYNIGTTPDSPDDIEPLKIIFPNASANGGGGGLNPGDRVYLGTVPAGKMVGWFLVADGWDSNTLVGPGLYTYYSNSNLNPEASADLRDHTIAVYDPIFHRIVLGFEDKFRGPGGGSDHDFNDVMFSIEVTPESSIDPEDLPTVIPPTDTDGDGIPDDEDDYPTDPTKAFNNYTPGENVWGTLAYEDLWPQYGDFDFNDLVIDYNINQITNGYNRVAYVESKYKVVAIGARHSNGFAVQYPVPASNITNLTSNYAGFTLEPGGSKAVIRVFDSAFDIIPQVVGGAFINTEPGQPWHTPDPQIINLNFKLVTPVFPSTFDHQPPYNPFLFKTNDRGLEVHLAGYEPSPLVNPAYFGTLNDGSLPGTGHYYYSEDNLPFALNIASTWNYPLEKVQITKGYLKFVEWAQSNGSSYPDWYLDRPDYLNETYIYQRP